MLLWFFDYFCFFGSETERSRNNCKIISVVTSIYIINTRLARPFARLTFALLYVLWTKFSLMLNSKKIRGSIWDLKQVKRWLKHYNAEFAVSDILHCFALLWEVHKHWDWQLQEWFAKIVFKAYKSYQHTDEANKISARRISGGSSFSYPSRIITVHYDKKRLFSLKLLSLKSTRNNIT